MSAVAFAWANHGTDVPERILANRLASGETTVEEYERLRVALHQRTPR
jgi:uncharacterized membrane protein